jgi:hypothetical protein
LLLNRLQSVPVKSPVVPDPAFEREKLTFGHTLAHVPFVIESAGVEEVMFPKVREDCLLLNIFQSVLDKAHVAHEDESQRERVEPETESPFPGVPIEIDQSLLLKVFQSSEESHPLDEVVA